MQFNAAADTVIDRLHESRDTFADVTKSGSLKVITALMRPAVRGYVLRLGKQDDGRTDLPTAAPSHLDWRYRRDRYDRARLYRTAKQSQWDADVVLDWSTPVEIGNPSKPLMDPTLFPLQNYPAFQRLSDAEKADQGHALVSWLLSQFLHGEQGALFAACQVTQAVGWLDGKLYGATQAMDEGRHVEVFHRYLDEKLKRLYEVNDNLYVVIDALMTDSRWDMKFLGMQILIEGLALGAFGALRQVSSEPLLRKLLEYVMRDEARHVAFGVLALQRYYKEGLSAAELREREDWCFEMSILLRNRFLAHEVYDEYWAHKMPRRQWNEIAMTAPFMLMFRKRMFKRIIPNLKRIGLLSDRIRPYYAELGLLDYEHGKAAPELGADELVQDTEM